MQITIACLSFTLPPAGDKTPMTLARTHEHSEERRGIEVIGRDKATGRTAELEEPRHP